MNSRPSCRFSPAPIGGREKGGSIRRKRERNKVTHPRRTSPGTSSRRPSCLVASKKVVVVFETTPSHLLHINEEKDGFKFQFFLGQNEGPHSPEEEDDQKRVFSFSLE